MLTLNTFNVLKKTAGLGGKLKHRVVLSLNRVC